MSESQRGHLSAWWFWWLWGRSRLSPPPLYILPPPIEWMSCIPYLSKCCWKPICENPRSLLDTEKQFFTLAYTKELKFSFYRSFNFFGFFVKNQEQTGMWTHWNVSVWENDESWSEILTNIPYISSSNIILQLPNYPQTWH